MATNRFLSLKQLASFYSISGKCLKKKLSGVFVFVPGVPKRLYSPVEVERIKSILGDFEKPNQKK